MQASASAVQRAGVNKSFTGMGSRAGSTAKLPISRTASGSVLDKRQEHDTGMITRVFSSISMQIPSTLLFWLCTCSLFCPYPVECCYSPLKGVPSVNACSVFADTFCNAIAPPLPSVQSHYDGLLVSQARTGGGNLYMQPDTVCRK